MDRAHLNRVLFLGLFGLFLFLGGWVLFWLRMASRDLDRTTGLIIPLGVVALGFLTGIGALGYGLWYARRSPKNSPVVAANGVYIIAKLAEGKEGPVYDTDSYDGKIDYLVQVALANGARLEFKTSREVFDTIGEGLKGRIMYQGSWLGQFERQIGEEANIKPYVP